MLVGGPQNGQDNLSYPTVNVPCSKDVLKFMLQYRMQQIKNIEKKLRGYNVVIEETRANDKILVTARSDVLDRALEMVHELIDKVVCDSFEIVQPGISTYCTKGRLDSLTTMVSNQEKCHIRVKKKFLNRPSTSSTSNGTAVVGTGSTSPNNTGGPAVVSPVVVGSNVSSSANSSVIFITPQGHKISWKIGDIATEQVR